MTSLDLGIAAVYVAGMLAVGYAVSRALGGFRDFFVAGGSMSTPVLVCTLVSTYYGLDVLFGGSEVGYVDGVVGWFFYTRPYYLAIVLVALLLAPRIRRGGVMSLPDVAARVYGRRTQALVAAASFFYALPLLAVMGLGVLMDVLLGWPVWLGVTLGAAISLVYTLMGGLLADALTDTVQFTLMCVTLGVASWLTLEPAGGFATLERALPPSFFDPRGTYPLAVLLVFGLSALSVLVEPAFYQRIVAARSLRAIVGALVIGIALWAAFDWIVTVLGMAARAQGLDTEPRYALLTVVIDVLPVGLTGLFVAGVIATAMSTIDSYLLIAGGNLAYDLYRPVARRALGDADLLRLTRWGIVVAAVVSVAFALVFTSMVSAWVFMSTILVATALVPVLAGLIADRPLPPTAGALSAGAGLTGALAFTAAVATLGEVDPRWGTTIWRVTAFGTELELWQEYAVLVALPLSAAGFGVGWALDRMRTGGPTAGT